MVLDIALGIVLAVIILSLLPVLIAIAGYVLVYGIALALVIGLLYWAVNDSATFAWTALVVASLYAAGRLLGMAETWLSAHSRFRIEDFFAFGLGAVFVAVMAVLLVQDALSPQSTVGDLMVPILLITVMGLMARAQYIRVKLRPPPAQKSTTPLHEDAAL